MSANGQPPEPKRPVFATEQRQELQALGLYPEQVRRLEIWLPSIRGRLARAAPMQEVRGKLTDLAETLKRMERLYLRIAVPASKASGEASSRLYVAQEALGYTNIDTLHDSLESATAIVNRALADLPRVQRSTRRNSRDFIGLILKALQLGHVEHFECMGYGDVPAKDAMPPFLIRVARKKKPFPQVTRVVSEASGGWSSDDAIAAYLKARGGK